MIIDWTLAYTVRETNRQTDRQDNELSTDAVERHLFTRTLPGAALDRCFQAENIRQRRPPSKLSIAEKAAR